MMELWVMVTGGDSDDERKIAESNNIDDIIKAIDECSEEVENDLDKYFELSTEHQAFVFGSMYDFEHGVLQALSFML